MSDDAATAQAMRDFDRRLTNLETRLPDTLDRIFAQLDGLKLAISDLKVAIAGQTKCPNPGLCVTVQGDIASLKERFSTLETRLIEVTKGLEDVSRWRFGVGGVLTFLAVAAGIVIGIIQLLK